MLNHANIAFTPGMGIYSYGWQSFQTTTWKTNQTNRESGNWPVHKWPAQINYLTTEQLNCSLSYIIFPDVMLSYSWFLSSTFLTATRVFAEKIIYQTAPILPLGRSVFLSDLGIRTHFHFGAYCKNFLTFVLYHKQNGTVKTQWI